ncbi:hypothetical protein H0Z09_22775 [Pseudomonas sp. SWRI18]|uniref:hypothetical protein n=1 Tax=Pseudomonas sp. SWRI18 TaxID=2753888 RepID=UPI0016496F8A|nr:hypothetical protein [Pseudomonas sp. SWRI18]MBC3303961.1 hypothetical protein [Pseudomonas sp. SWRI18]
MPLKILLQAFTLRDQAKGGFELAAAFQATHCPGIATLGHGVALPEKGVFHGVSDGLRLLLDVAIQQGNLFLKDVDMFHRLFQALSTQLVAQGGGLQGAIRAGKVIDALSYRRKDRDAKDRS